MNIENKINKLMFKYFSRLDRCIPKEFLPLDTKNISATIVESSITQLNSITNNNYIKDSNLIERVDSSAVARFSVKLDEINLMLENETNFIYYMSLSLNQSLRELNSVLGNLNGRKIHTVWSDGNTYVRYNTSLESYEFRVFVEENKKEEKV